MSNISDETRMWFGKYKGKELGFIPDDYLQYLLDRGICFGPLKHYIKTLRGITKWEITSTCPKRTK